MKTLPTTIPSTMKALVLKEFNGKPLIEELPVPEPGKGQILVKIHASPINPSDHHFIYGNYPTEKTLPVVPGFEASGKVIATGNDYMSRRLLGKNVNCLAPLDGNGTWAEYMVTDKNLALPLKKEIDLEQGSMLFVNPFSALGMVDMAIKEGHKAIANTAAASALGQMLLRFCKHKKLDLVNIVRREEQVALLKEQGATHVLNSSEKNFTSRLKETFNSLGVTLAYDAIAGDMPGILMEALPIGGKVRIYGGLSDAECKINPLSIIFKKKAIDGFYLLYWINNQNIFNKISSANTILKNIDSQFYSKIHKKVSPENFSEGLHTYLSEMTKGKILIMFNGN
jgi:NADPH:quinone reductase-like Zn-dependent oxidoreductase